MAGRAKGKAAGGLVLCDAVGRSLEAPLAGRSVNQKRGGRSRHRRDFGLGVARLRGEALRMGGKGVT